MATSGDGRRRKCIFSLQSTMIIAGCLKLAFHDTDIDTDNLARFLADTSDTRDFLKLFR